MLKVLADTNIILDFYLERQPWFPAANRLFLEAASKRLQMVVPATSLKDVFYIATKAVGEEGASRVVDHLMRVAEVGPITADTCRLARKENEADFEDGLVAAVAREQAVDIILSRDKDAFAQACAPKISADAFVSFFLDANSNALFFEQNGDEIRQL